ncbi:MAG: hypothetical protein Kow0062_23080 [Acidobacteriota bacterium]
MGVATIVELWLVCCVGAGFAVFYAWRHRAVEGAVAGFLGLAVACCGGILAAVWLAGLVQATFLSLNHPGFSGGLDP